MYCPISLCFEESAMIRSSASLAHCPTLPSLCTYGINSENITNLVVPWSDPALKSNSKTCVSRDRHTASWWRTCISCDSTDSLGWRWQSQDTSNLISGRMIGLWTSRVCRVWPITNSYILRACSFILVESSDSWLLQTNNFSKMSLPRVYSRTGPWPPFSAYSSTTNSIIWST